MELVGQQVGAYRILSLLGRGGTAEVYKAFHPALKREVALKVILQEVSHDHDWVRRFHQEAELLGKLDHPHILPIYDAGEHEGRPYLVTKYMADSAPLRSQLTEQPWPLNRVAKVVSQVADALEAAHQAGVVHRDIKPSNILITPDLKCLVFDFGIAKPFRREDATTGSGLIVGTPEFMSPEQCKGERLDHRSDLYSLGVLTYQMLTGRVPYSAETAVGILMKHLTEPLPIPPRGVALPPAVNGVLRKAMARDPNDRYGSAAEFSQAFAASAEQRATVTLHSPAVRNAPTSTLQLPAWVKKLDRRETRFGLATVVLLTMLFFVYVLWPKGAPDPVVVRTTDPPIFPVDEGEGSALPRGPIQVAGSGTTNSAPGPAPPAAQVSTGALRIESTEEAKVLLDGEPIGTAPGEFQSVTPGAHTVVLDAGHGRLQEETVVVTAGSTHHLRFDFKEAPRNLTGATARAHQVGGTTAGTSAGAENFDVPPDIRVWTGFLTDSDCGVTGGRQGALHLRCAERCIRQGQQPMLYSRGKLYRLEGFEHVEIVRDGPLTFRGWLELDTIHVVPPES